MGKQINNNQQAIQRRQPYENKKLNSVRGGGGDEGTVYQALRLVVRKIQVVSILQEVAHAGDSLLENGHIRVAVRETQNVRDRQKRLSPIAPHSFSDMQLDADRTKLIWRNAEQAICQPTEPTKWSAKNSLRYILEINWFLL